MRPRPPCGPQWIRRLVSAPPAVADRARHRAHRRTLRQAARLARQDQRPRHRRLGVSKLGASYRRTLLGIIEDPPSIALHHRDVPVARAALAGRAPRPGRGRRHPRPARRERLPAAHRDDRSPAAQGHAERGLLVHGLPTGVVHPPRADRLGRCRAGALPVGGVFRARRSSVRSERELDPVPGAYEAQVGLAGAVRGRGSSGVRDLDSPPDGQRPSAKAGEDQQVALAREFEVAGALVQAVGIVAREVVEDERGCDANERRVVEEQDEHKRHDGREDGALGDVEPAALSRDGIWVEGMFCSRAAPHRGTHEVPGGRAEHGGANEGDRAFLRSSDRGDRRAGEAKGGCEGARGEREAGYTSSEVGGSSSLILACLCVPRAGGARWYRCPLVRRASGRVGVACGRVTWCGTWGSKRSEELRVVVPRAVGAGAHRLRVERALVRRAGDSRGCARSRGAVPSAG